jgi:hypothetical protein
MGDDRVMRIRRVGITLLKHELSAQIPWQYTMLGFVSVDFDSIGQANFEIVISCSDGQAAAGRRLAAPR